jgi:hypothetical protein
MLPVERTQISLTTQQLEGLRRLSEQEGASIAKLIRGAVDRLLREQGTPDREERRRRALAVVGRFQSGRHDISEEHDRYFAESIDE